MKKQTVKKGSYILIRNSPGNYLNGVVGRVIKVGKSDFIADLNDWGVDAHITLKKSEDYIIIPLASWQERRNLQFVYNTGVAWQSVLYDGSAIFTQGRTTRIPNSVMTYYYDFIDWINNNIDEDY